ncbi:MAG: cbb3-type cytochrome c oxidase subunit II [Alphaproteobacteria bacterium]|nr:cbb3-type cytochrome c oxidase subunit II [Alphaproteobacteria bacterium]
MAIPTTHKPSIWQRHAVFEKNSIILVIGILVAISIGGLVEVLPLFYLKSTIEKVEGIRPYSPLELAGRNIYVREGCYDHPFQWGSKRTGPDLARVGGKYSDDWHRDHLRNPRSVVPASIMPGYPWLEQTPLNISHIGEDMAVLSVEGVPYTQEMIAAATSDAKTQGSAEDASTKALLNRYPRAIIRDLGGNNGRLTEADALVAYLQLLGTQVDFKLYDDKANIR